MEYPEIHFRWCEKYSRGYFIVIVLLIFAIHNEGTMVRIVCLPAKKMGHATYKWLKTVDFGMKCSFRGTNFNASFDEKPLRSIFL
jgi:uncharacterized protein YprB with RNaseH-like and TPR domain